jgi:inosine-uridine nucleoside N-ribohydrolase
MDVEMRGELTRGMCVIDQRPWQRGNPNIDLAIDVDAPAVHEYVARVLKMAPPMGVEH